MAFEVPSVKLVLSSERSDINRDLGVFDPNDAGLFDSRESTIDSWKLVVDTKKWKIEQIRRTDDSDLKISLEHLKITDVDYTAQNQRFPWLILSEQGFTIDINRCDRDADIYKNCDMTVKFTCSEVRANWKPKAINRLLRFLRYKNFKRNAFKLWLNQCLFRFKQMKLITKEKE